MRIHSYSEWSSINIDRLPVAVVWPSSTEDVSKIAVISSKYKVPMSESQRYLVQTFNVNHMLIIMSVPYSGGSSVERHVSSPFGGVSIDFMNMSSIV